MRGEGSSEDEGTGWERRRGKLRQHERGGGRTDAEEGAARGQERGLATRGAAGRAARVEGRARLTKNGVRAPVGQIRLRQVCLAEGHRPGQPQRRDHRRVSYRARADSLGEPGGGSAACDGERLLDRHLPRRPLRRNTR